MVSTPLRCFFRAEPLLLAAEAAAEGLPALEKLLLLPESERRRGGAWDGPVEREERDILGIVCCCGVRLSTM